MQCYWMIFSSRTRIWLTESPQHCKSEVEERVPYLPQHYSGRTLSGNCDDQLLWVSRLARLNFQEWMMTWCEYWALVSLLATPIMVKSVESVVFFNRFWNCALYYLFLYNELNLKVITLIQFGYFYKQSLSIYRI